MFKALVTCSLLIAARTACSQTGEGAVAPADYGVQRININSGQNDYAPVFSNGELLFTSENRQRMGAYFSSADASGQLSNVFRSRLINDTVFEAPALLDNKLNRFYNCGTACFTADRKTVFFSSNEPTAFLLATSKVKSPLRIWSAQADGDNWSKKTVLPFGEDSVNYTHPFLSASGDTLYFASDRPGGSGGYDLYYSLASGGSWSAPVNLGAVVNSSANELFPAASEGRLIFSSNREGGAGKLDLYSYSFSEHSLMRLPSPFNSAADDFGFSPVTKRKGYFSSNRDGNDDIYFYHELFPAFENCEPYVKDKFCFTFFEDTEELEEGLQLEYEWSLGDGTRIKGREAKHCFAGYGEYLVELNIIDRSGDSLFSTQASYPFVIEPTERLHINGPDTVPLSVAVTWSALNSIVPGGDIEQFYWEADGGAFRKSNSDTAVLTFTTAGNHELVLGVRASMQEGGGLRELCVSKTIVVVDGYELILRDRTPPVLTGQQRETGDTTTSFPPLPGVSDTLIGHGGLDEYRDQQSETELSDEGLVHKNELAATEVIEVETIFEDRILEEQVTSSLEVFYAYDAFVLTPENKQLLKTQVPRQLSAKGHILITSFTDSKGDDTYNQKLSEKRSESVRNELIALGIPPDRIEMENYGKRIPQDMQPFTDAQRRKSLILVYEK